MTKTSKFALSVLTAGAVALALVPGAQAVPITGTINFSGGTVTLNNPTSGGIGTGVGQVNTITAFGGTTVVNNDVGTTPTGSFTGTGGSAVTFVSTGFTFAPALSPAPVSPLWTFTSGGLTYQFTLSAITGSNIGAGGALNLAGTGIFHISGGSFTDTAGTFALTTVGTGPITLGFVAGDASVPDAGTTAILLGLGLTALAVFARFRKHSVA